MAPKIILFSVFLLLAGIVSARNVTLGDPSEGKLLYHQKFEKIPKPGVTEISRGTINIKDGVITAIVIQDLQGDGRSFVLSGGIGENKVKIELIGERGTGFKFIIDVYGKPGEPLSKSADSSKDKSDKVDETKGKSLNPDELSEGKSENPEEVSKDKSDKVDEPKDKSEKPDEVSKDKSDKVDEPKDKSEKPDEVPKDKSDKVDEPKDKSEKPDEVSKDKSDKVDEPKDKSEKPDEVKSEQPSRDKMKLVYTPDEA